MIGKEQQDSAKFSNWRPKATEPGRFVSYAVDDGMDCLSQLSQLSATRLRAVSSSGGQSLESAPSKPRRYYLSRIADARSEEHTSELQSLMRISYAVFCLK